MGEKARKAYNGFVTQFVQDGYEEGSMGGLLGGDAVTVPDSSPNGGIIGSQNPLGLVVLGDKITGSKSGGGEAVIGRVPAIGLGPHGEVLALDKALELASPAPVHDVEQILEQAAADVAASRAGRASRKRKPGKATAEPVEESPTPSPVPKPGLCSDKVRVSISGSFGSNRGVCRKVAAGPTSVMLFYDADDPMYTPPASEDPLTLVCGDDTYQVQYVGLEVELPFLHAVVQTYLLYTQE